MRLSVDFRGAPINSETPGEVSHEEEFFFDRTDDSDIDSDNIVCGVIERWSMFCKKFRGF